jgi:tetratricopeptide (TPR) repeat protein/SAM-dependent methyltransferase
MTTNRTCATPNQHAGPATLTLTPSAATFGGYQGFVLTRHTVNVLPTDRSLAIKSGILDPVFQPALLSGRQLLDLGANSACFSFLALQRGAAGATAVDLDAHHLANARRAADALGFDRLETATGNVADWEQPADVVLGLALVHWLYNCTASFRSLHAVVQHLAQLTRYALIVEWIDPEDPAIARFGHLDWQPGEARDPYRRDIFERELAAQFARVRPLGDVSPTRRLWMACKTAHDIDLSCPLPLQYPADTVVSCSRLTVHEGIPYWSRVHDLGDRIVKQTSGGLAAREAVVLRRMAGAAVPHVESATDDGDTSSLTMEKVPGLTFRAAAPALAGSEPAFREFLAATLDLLCALAERDIAHRDVHESNVLVRAGKPVLIDFGWATAAGLPIVTPEGFAARRNSSDVQAFGRLLLSACPATSPLRPLVAVMANDDPALRIDDPRRLRDLHQDVIAPADRASSSTALLLAQIVARDTALAAVRRELHHAAAAAESHQRQLADAELRLAEAERLAASRAAPEDAAAFHVSLTSPGLLPDRVTATAWQPYGLALIAALRRSGQPGAALDIAARLSEQARDPEDPQAWLTAAYAHASLCRELGRDDEALAGFERLLAQDPAVLSPALRGGAAFHSALLLQRQGDVEGARARLQQCLTDIPDHAGARAALVSLGAT